MDIDNRLVGSVLALAIGTILCACAAKQPDANGRASYGASSGCTVSPQALDKCSNTFKVPSVAHGQDSLSLWEPWRFEDTAWAPSRGSLEQLEHEQRNRKASRPTLVTGGTRELQFDEAHEEEAVDPSATVDEVSKAGVWGWYLRNQDVPVYVKEEGERIRTYDVTIGVWSATLDDPKWWSFSVVIDGYTHIVKVGDAIPGTNYVLAEVSLSHARPVTIPPGPRREHYTTITYFREVAYVSIQRVG